MYRKSLIKREGCFFSRRRRPRLRSVPDIVLTLIGKPGCHLCDDARVVVNTVVRDLSTTHTAGSPSISVRESSIEDDAELFTLYGEQIPVLLINGKVHNFWRIDPVRLTASLKELL